MTCEWKMTSNYNKIILYFGTPPPQLVYMFYHCQLQASLISCTTLVTISMMMLPPTNMSMGKIQLIQRRSWLKMFTSQLYCHNQDRYRWGLVIQLGCLVLWISYQVREFVCTVDRIPGAIVCMHCE